MTTRELIEWALLDALALLDEGEHAAFDRAFAAAPPPVQAQVRREQTRLAHIELLLPDVTPPAGLRAAVVEAVRLAMLEPETAGSLLVPPMTSARSVSRWWRAGSLGLATAAAFFIGSTVFLWNANVELRANTYGDALLEQLATQVGHARVRDLLLDPDTQRVVFTRVADDSKAEASIFLNPEWENATFVCAGLASADNRPYRLAIVDENDQVVRELAVIDANGLITPRNVTLDPKQPARLAVFAPSSGSEPGPIVSRGALGL